MGDRFGTNSSLYDLSRLMTFAVGIPAQNTFSAPIILDNPAITSGVALFSHTPQPFSVAVAAASELTLIDLSLANTAGAGTQFYGVKIQTDDDTVDTGAGIAIFNTGRADAIYIDVAGKAANAASNTPTGIGIDVNKSPASSAERASTNSRQIGVQIFDWSTTNQGVGGPSGMLMQKQSNLNTDHFLMTLRGNRNMQQMVVVSGDAGYDAGMPVWRLDDETTAANWLSLVARGEFIFNKDGVGIQWITPGAKTAYILASTNDLKLKSGGTGVRFVNQADTQTIVMMQDDLSVDIPNNETRFQAIKIVSDRIEQYSTNGLGSVSVNYNGYNGGTTQFRDFKVFDGKQQVVAIFDGAAASLTVTNKITIGSTSNTTSNALIVNGQGVNYGAVPARYNAYLFDTTAFAAGVGSGLGLGGNFGPGQSGFFGIISAKKANGTSGDATGVMDLTVSSSSAQVLGLKLLSDGTSVDAQFPQNLGVGVFPTIPLDVYHTTDVDSSTITKVGDTATSPAVLVLRKAKAGTAIVASGDRIGQVTFRGYDGSAYQNAAQIRVEVDGTPGAGDMPGRLLIYTTPDGSTTLTERVRITNDGLISLNSMIYGGMYADDISQAVTVASAGVYYEVPGSITGGICNGFTFQSSKQLLATVAGTYEVNWSMSITSANNNENIAGAAMVNSTEAHNTEGSAQCINAGKPISVSGHGIIALAVNDVVKFCVENEDAAHNITVLHANMSITRIGA